MSCNYSVLKKIHLTGDIVEFLSNLLKMVHYTEND